MRHKKKVIFCCGFKTFGDRYTRFYLSNDHHDNLRRGAKADAGENGCFESFLFETESEAKRMLLQFAQESDEIKYYSEAFVEKQTDITDQDNELVSGYSEDTYVLRLPNRLKAGAS